jgi:hypothetical protein
VPTNIRLDRLHAAFSADDEDWSSLRAEVGGRPTVCWVPACVDPDEPWGIETHPFVLFGEQETNRLGLPRVDLFLYSDDAPRLWEDLHRTYGGPKDEELRGKTVIFREHPGRGHPNPLVEWALSSRGGSIEVELTSVIPLLGFDEPLSASLARRLREQYPWASVEQSTRHQAFALEVDVSYQSDDEDDEEHAVLYVPASPAEAIDDLIPQIASPPEIVILTRRALPLLDLVVRRLAPRWILVERCKEVPAGYSARNTSSEIPWSGTRLLERLE